MLDPEVEPPARRGDARSAWLSPAGISAMAGVAGLLLIVIGWFVAGELRGDAAPTPEQTQPSSAENLIFVYGSAMPGQWGYDVIDRYVESSTRDEVEGSLYDSGRGYPLAKFDLGGSIPGFLIKLDEATLDDAMRALAAFEGGLFAPVEVRTQSGATALAYEWIASTDGYPRIDYWDSDVAGNYGIEVPVITLATGECFDPTATVTTGFTSVASRGIIVNCSALPAYTVYHSFELAVAEYPGEQELWGAARAECGSEFASRYGGVLDPEVDPWYLPTPSAWSQGDRALVCAALASR